MQKIDGKRLLNEARQIAQAQRHERDQAKRQAALAKAEGIAQEFVNFNPDSVDGLYTLGSVMLDQGRYGAAISMFRQCAALNPNLVEVWNNLGLCYRLAERKAEAIEALNKACEIQPNPVAFGNLAACYVNNGTPREVLKIAGKALALDPNDHSAQWNKCLALLELGRWGEAWGLHELRLGGNIENRIEVRNYHGPDRKTPWWDGKSRSRVVCHGEQGLGDEIMFASCVPDAIATGAQLILEPSPRLQKLFRRSFPQTAVFGTNKVQGEDWKPAYGLPDCMTAFGTLPKFFRPNAAAFPRKPYLVADETETARILTRLPLDKPLIGIAWEGGVKKTHYSSRSIPLARLWPILRQDATFVSLNYTPDTQQEIETLWSETNVRVHHFPDLVEAPADMDHMANLMAGLDLIITVSQTAFHLAGALGKQCWVLAPSRPDWRLGVSGDHIPWYGDNLRIIRQVGDDWDGVVWKTANDLANFLATLATEPKPSPNLQLVA